jgi:hypothetical protein
MSLRNRVLAAATGLGLVLAVPALAAGTASTASASTPLVSASTSITNSPDSGGNGNWANDDITRTLTINTDTTSSDCASLAGWDASADVCYSGSISDSGTANTIVSGFQPNQGSSTAADQTGDKITGPSEGVPFTGTASFQFYAPTGDIPSAANVPATLNSNFTEQTGASSTSEWYLEAFTTAGRAGVNTDGLGNWSWTYANSCESWTDANTNGDGQSTPLSDDGNITGKVCPASSPAPAGFSGGNGDVINLYGNGLDVKGQRDAVNTPVIAWPVTSTDPAVRFDFIAVNGGWAIEYAPTVDTGLCVSEAVGSQPKGSAPTGLVLRGCSWNKFQTFTLRTGANGSFQLVNAATGQTIQPNGTRAQITGTSTVTNGPGSWWGWNTRGAVPAAA